MKHVFVIIIFGLLMSLGATLDVLHAQSVAPTPPTTGIQSGASAQTPQQAPASSSASESRIDRIGDVLFLFLALAVVFESALNSVFNWRAFLLYFEGHGVKTPVIVVLAFIVFRKYDLDIVKDLLLAFDHPAKMNWGGQFLSALLIAGGSDGVLNIFAKLGIRKPEERKEKAKLILLEAKAKAEAKAAAKLAGGRTGGP